MDQGRLVLLNGFVTLCSAFLWFDTTEEVPREPDYSEKSKQVAEKQLILACSFRLYTTRLLKIFL
jgi:hypothetical protein